MMLKTFFHSKIHRIPVSSVNLEYQGSITIDADLLEQAQIQIYEQVHVLNLNNGHRFITYAIEGERKSKTVQVNGAAAHLCKTGDLLIVVTYCQLNEQEQKNHQPKVIHFERIAV